MCLKLRLSVTLLVAFLVTHASQNTYLIAADESAAVETFDAGLKPFLRDFCFECHAGEDASSERNFDTLTGELSTTDQLIELQEILDQLNRGEMPPREAKQPTDDERRKAAQWLSTVIGEYHRRNRSTGGQTILRRLNAREYENTIRDLLHLNMSMFRPTASFPRDQLIEHRDNDGKTLVMSGYLLSQYLDAAERIVEKAMFPLNQPIVQTWHFEDGFRQQPEIDQVHRNTSRFQYLILYDVPGADKHEGAYAPIHAFADGVPYDGYYDIKFRAAALNRLHPYDDRFLGRDSTEPLRLAVVAGNRNAGPLHKPQPIEPVLAEVTLADGWDNYQVRVWLDAGFTPRFIFPNGLMDARSLWGNLHRRHSDLLPEPANRGIVEVRRNAITNGKLPQIHVDDITISGPHYDAWPRPSQLALLGEDWLRVVSSGELDSDTLTRNLRRLASEAYRRPATDDEVARLVKIATQQKDLGRSDLQAFGDSVNALISSPAFAYLDETSAGADGPPGRLSQLALAARLSYFLWASMPDAELTDVAIRNELQTPEQILIQFDRMLKDPKSSAFIEGFLDNWLALRDLGSSPPDRSEFRDYYQYDLGTAMKTETRLFARYLLDNNLSVCNFLDSDFTILNKPLADLYGLNEPFEDAGFHLVKLADRRRGGLLGQASVLTVTANGIDTSPVVRGVWLLNNILGTPPSPPPPDVPPLDPDVRGAESIRDQLAKHRDVSACYDCHRRIDPPGFALENFDPIGRWRERYKRGPVIDASGELPTGQDFRDVRGLKKLLLEQDELFIRNLTSQLLAYAVGRDMEIEDRPAIDTIVEAAVGQAAADGQPAGFRDLLQHVVTSEIFLSE
ncbi:MAG: DUF1592 domain-containing protein [Planctomycetaceae bacterium]|nr:DUF1592 domain-containing protein [Planctomycetaceae bacterium]